MGEYVYRPDDEEKMADHLARATEIGKRAMDGIKTGSAKVAGSLARMAAYNARRYMMLRAVTGRD